MRAFLYLLVLLWVPTALFAETPLRVRPIPSWVVPADLPPNRESGSAFDLRLMDVQFRYDDTGQHRFVRTVTRILTPQGLAAGGSALVVWKPGLSTTVLHKLEIRRGGQTIDVLDGGRKFETLRREANLGVQMDGVLTSVMQIPDVRVGDEIEFSFTVTINNPVLAGKTEALDAFPPRIDFGRFNLRYSWPRTRGMFLKAGNALPIAKAPGPAGDEVFAFSRDRFTMPLTAAGAPARFGRNALIQITDISNWSEVASIMAPLYQAASQSSPDSPISVEAKRIATLSPDPLVRAGAALEMVQSQIRYFARSDGLGGYLPETADKVWEMRAGDCKGKTVLLIALLRKLGIDAVPALVSSTAGDGLDQALPMAAQFDHVIVKTMINGKTYWIDGTGLGDRSIETAMLKDFRWALPVVQEGSTLEKIEPKAPAMALEEFRLDLDARSGRDKPAKATGMALLRGEDAATTRALLSFMSSETKEEFHRKFWADRHDWITIETVSDTFDAEKGELRLSMTGTGKMDWETLPSGGVRYEANKARLGFSLTPDRPEGFKDAAPVAVSSQYTATRQTILLPEGEFEIDGQNMDKTFGGITYTRTATLAGNRFEMLAASRSSGTEISYAEAKKADEQTDSLYALRLFVRSRQPSVPVRPLRPADPSRIVNKAVQIAGSISDEDYPPGAILDEQQGTTVVTMDIGTDGGVAACSIAGSSGFPLLDDQSCALVKERFRFRPASDRRGRALIEQKTQRITWRLPEGSSEILPEDLTVSYIISADGEVSDCKASGGAPGLTPLDRVCEFIPGGIVKDKNGNPIAARVVRKTSTSIIPVEDNAPPKAAPPQPF